MYDRSYEQYKKLHEAIQTDEELFCLMYRLRKEQEHLQTVMDVLSQEQREIITEYLGILAEIWDRTVELASFLL